MMPTLDKPTYDRSLHQWMVQWGFARFFFHTWDAANTFYLENNK